MPRIQRFPQGARPRYKEFFDRSEIWPAAMRRLCHRMGWIVEGCNITPVESGTDGNRSWVLLEVRTIQTPDPGVDPPAEPEPLNAVIDELQRLGTIDTAAINRLSAAMEAHSQRLDSLSAQRQRQTATARAVVQETFTAPTWERLSGRLMAEGGDDGEQEYESSFE